MITGRDLIQLGSRFAVMQDGEPVWRTSIGRSYYGAFHCARHFLFDVLRIPTLKGRHNPHIRVQDFLRASKHLDAQIASNLLGSMSKSRNNADYDIRVDNYGEQKKAIHQHGLADRVVQLLDACETATIQHEDMREAIARFRSINQC